MNHYVAERKVLIVSTTSVVLLMIWGLVFSELTTSNIVELDAEAYIVSAVVGLVTIYVSTLQSREGTDSHPLGYAGYVPILNMVRNLMIVVICIDAVGESIGTLVRGTEEIDHGPIFLYASVTLLINLFCALYISFYATKTKSELLKTDSLEWRIDTVMNISILMAFLLAYVLETRGFTFYAACVDPVVCILFSLYMCYAPGKLLIENMKILSAASVEKETKEAILAKFFQQTPELSIHNPHFTICRVANLLWVNMEVPPETDGDLLVNSNKMLKQIVNEVQPNNKVSYSIKH
jgi:predicted Co/Zn/Cd cation transporter (cation efflux family)